MSAKSYWLLGWLAILAAVVASTVVGILLPPDITGTLSVLQFFAGALPAWALYERGWHPTLYGTRLRR